MSNFSKDDISKLYAEQAEKHGALGTSTIQDARTRTLELDAISSYIEHGMKVLEVGCGNGYIAKYLVDKFDIDMRAFDISSEMIRIAQTRDVGDEGLVIFSVGNVLDECDFSMKFNLVFSVRCLQNLTSWDLQRTALSNISNVIETNGYYVMEECFWTGANNLNEARSELGLKPIPQSWHNTYFDEGRTIEFMSTIGMRYVDQNAFLSGYYFGSRVLLPALSKKNAAHTSKLNDYFCHLPPAGDFCPMKILRFRKNG